ncbi:hypothetical protein [Allonocardiopsis opalescens]|uniref:Uncharacterized protein n=1 Tax=Allonocardiopsis opalescens TaxID=1144618 RepID=A0A2T0PZQ2_9ACTN|nr:hypothetical protein [Allonocardiopsis opalescens]PRX97032.1 hypothetical protein CLV72_10668 [Allonocardiopsis opalescens]
MSVPAPSETTRWRCAQCGNLTRFDVTRTTRSRDYVHFDLSGAASTESSEVLAETVEQIQCRWCKAVDAVEAVARPGVDAGRS